MRSERSRHRKHCSSRLDAMIRSSDAKPFQCVLSCSKTGWPRIEVGHRWKVPSKNALIPTSIVPSVRYRRHQHLGRLLAGIFPRREWHWDVPSVTSARRRRSPEHSKRSCLCGCPSCRDFLERVRRGAVQGRVAQPGCRRAFMHFTLIESRATCVITTSEQGRAVSCWCAT